MTISGRTIAKNAGFLMASQIITWGLSFLLTIFLSRRLGPQGIGQLQLAGSLWAIVAVVSALGTDRMVTKEIARSPGRLNELVSTAFALRGLIFMFCALGIVVYVRLVGYPDQTVIIIWVVGISAVVGQLSGTYDAALKGLERMEYTSLAGVVSTALVSSLCIGLLLLGFGVIPIAAVGIIANITSLAIQAYFLHKLYAYQLSVNWRLIRSVVTASIPYFLVSTGLVLYQQVDTVIISLLVDEKTIGWYGAAARLFGTLLFIPNVFVTVLFPALSRAYADSPIASQKLAQKSLNALVLVGIPIGFGIMVIANQLVVLLYGPDFSNSGPVLAIRGILLILTFVNMLLGSYLISMDRQKPWAVVILIAAFATILLDLILIPWAVKTYANGALGGAFSYAFTELGMTIAGFVLLPRGTFNRENGRAIFRVILAGGVMAAASWVVRDAFILIPVAVGTVTYIGMIAIMRAIPKEDWEIYLDIGTSFSHRLRGRFSRAAELKG